MKRIDPIARVLDAYTALDPAEQKAADYLIARVRKGEAIVAPARVGRPAGSKNRAKAAPLLNASERLSNMEIGTVNGAAAEGL